MIRRIANRAVFQPLADQWVKIRQHSQRRWPALSRQLETTYRQQVHPHRYRYGIALTLLSMFLFGYGRLDHSTPLDHESATVLQAWVRQVNDPAVTAASNHALADGILTEEECQTIFDIARALPPPALGEPTGPAVFWG